MLSAIACPCIASFWAKKKKPIKAQISDFFYASSMQAKTTYKFTKKVGDLNLCFQRSLVPALRVFGQRKRNLQIPRSPTFSMQAKTICKFTKKVGDLNLCLQRSLVPALRGFGQSIPN